jgi:hypothetical protein
MGSRRSPTPVILGLGLDKPGHDERNPYPPFFIAFFAAISFVP